MKLCLKDKKVLLLLFLAFAAPLLVQYSFDAGYKIKSVGIGLPRVYTGDEPYYFLTLYSIVNDKDIDLKNNYSQARLGGCDAGFVFSGRQLQESKLLSQDGLKWFPTRAIGLPVFAAILLWPMAGSCLLEAGAIILTFFATLATLFFIFKILCEKNKKIALFATFCFAFATPLWHYSKTFWTEPFLAAALIAAYYFFVVKKQNLLPSILLSFAFFLKYPAALLFAIFWIYRLSEKKFKQLILFSLPFAIAVLLLFAYSFFLSGNFLIPKSHETIFGNFLNGIIQWLFNPRFGLLVYSPFLAFGFLGFKDFFKKDRKNAIFCLLLFCVFFLFWSSIEPTQIGAGGYGARYMVPISPLLAIPLSYWLQANRNKLLNAVFLLFLALSILLSIQSAFFFPAAIDREPWFLLQQAIARLFGINL